MIDIFSGINKNDRVLIKGFKKNIIYDEKQFKHNLDNPFIRIHDENFFSKESSK